MIADRLMLTPYLSPQVVLDSDLFRMLGALLVVDVSLLVTWMTLHPPSRRVVVQNEGSHKVCNFNCKGFNR